MVYHDIEQYIVSKFPRDPSTQDATTGENASHQSVIKNLSRIYSGTIPTWPNHFGALAQRSKTSPNRFVFSSPGPVQMCTTPSFLWFGDFFSDSDLANQKHFFFLDKHVAAQTTEPFCVFGASGVGKSALLGNWVSRFIKHHPEDIVISHFVGCSSASTDYASLISRIMQEIQTQVGTFLSLPHPPTAISTMSSSDLSQTHRGAGLFKQTEFFLLIRWTLLMFRLGAKNMDGLTIPRGAAILVQDFGLWLAKATDISGRRLVLLIDGLERLEDSDNALVRLNHLPSPRCSFFLSRECSTTSMVACFIA